MRRALARRGLVAVLGLALVLSCATRLGKRSGAEERQVGVAPPSPARAHTTAVDEPAGPLRAFVEAGPLVGRLGAAIDMLETNHRPITPEEELEWGFAAAYQARRHGVDPFELLAIARNESDFRPELVGPDGKDCGLTQIRAKYSRYRCRELRSSVWVAFEETARRLRQNDERCARRKDDPRRCRLNTYNGGWRYARSGHAGRYWVRVTCFAEAARRGVRPVGDCRSARKLADIERIVGDGARKDEDATVTAAAEPAPRDAQPGAPAPTGQPAMF